MYTIWDVATCREREGEEKEERERGGEREGGEREGMGEQLIKYDNNKVLLPEVFNVI